ncbi:DUF5658 family protein [Thiohalobacter sp. IOR34]|uniref:DUF5658 family protein n=1 Tax=Thiohalobacter sp. IOR34 TaxID=3057176 RepID=UPI0025B044E7|nr:DUF5658 family protein [Thiohalobacter sp. IOR34]WJW74408.1 DUF5658 family protein [Thiohalobacter sp. IOR34]
MTVSPSKRVPQTEARPDKRALPDRRRFTWKTLVYGDRLRRRRGPRRESERSSYYIDEYGAHWFLMVFGIMVLCLLDAGLTILLLTQHDAVELNPVMDYLIQRDLRLFAVFKIILTGACLAVLVIHLRHRAFRLLPTGGLISMIFAGYLALIGWELLLLGYV